MACDGQCRKAWGINGRPHEDFDPADPDDYAFLADSELGDAPKNPGTYEFGEAKPAGPHEMNRWCARECERARTGHPDDDIELPDFSVRRFNQPWKHNAL